LLNKFFSLEKVEMSEKIVIYQPYDEVQILLAENASCLAVKTYLKVISNVRTLKQVCLTRSSELKYAWINLRLSWIFVALRWLYSVNT
jgi:hypothetical protein